MSAWLDIHPVFAGFVGIALGCAVMWPLLPLIRDWLDP